MNTLDKAIDDLGAVWSVDSGKSDTYFIVGDGQLWMRGDDGFDGLVCTRTEFEARVKERKLLDSMPVLSRIDIIGQNGNDGLHYDKPSHPVTAVDFFTAGAEILNQRGKQYDSSGEAERSFPQVAEAFTAITGRTLTGSDVCLVLNLVKKVRQYAQPDRLHHDSLLDSVNYDALWAQELTRELTGGNS